ncbi:MAG: AMP-binding protein, partial [bacterium]|nr:AMP-binding protein [bacterium]
LPFEKLVEEIQPERDMSRNPLFQVMLVLQNQPGGDAAFSAIEVEPVHLDPGTAKFDLTLFWWEQGDRLQGLVEFNTDLFDGTTIRRLQGHYLALVEALVADVDARPAELALLSRAERQHLVREWNDTRAPGLGGRPVHRWVEEQAALSPGEVALVDGGRGLTYRELNARANQLAWRLRALGVGPERLVGICVERSAEMVAGFLAVLKAGGAGVALDPAYPKDRNATIIRDAGMAVLLTQDHLLKSLPEHGGTNLLLTADWSAFAGEPTGDPGVGVDLDNPIYVIFTSGSTGQPKGIVVTHGAFANLVDWQLSCSSLARRARTVQFATFGFCVSFQEMFTSWCSGGSLVMADEMTRRDIDGLASFLESQEIERLHMPFAALKQLAEVAAGHDLLPARLKEVITAGEQLQVSPSVRALFERLPGCSLHNQYGASETHVVSAHSLP